MRGKRLFTELRNTGNIAPAKRGRNNTLIAKRNECLLARYYFYTNFTSKSYDDTVMQLVTEFFITPDRIGDVIQRNIEILDSIKEAQPSVYFFQNHWPHIKW